MFKRFSVLFCINHFNSEKRLIAVGKTKQEKKSIVSHEPITIATMSEEDYRAMIDPLLSIFRKKRNKNKGVY